MPRHILLRLRYLLPFPLSFRLMARLPKPVQSLLSRSYAQLSHHPRKPVKLHATSYLDGLRGLAALIVCVCHYTEENHPNLTTWYGVFPKPALALEPSWIQLPFIRVIFSGRPMVHVFFVISGFALSVRALAAARARNFEKCHAILASAAFRRPIRLCGPPVVSMVFIVLFVRAGWLWGALPTLRQQLNDWVAAVYYHVIWPWSWDAHLYPPYNVNLWTIPIELCHSMLLFMVILALSRVHTTARVTTALAFVVYCLHCGKWAAAEFIAGMLLAEAHLVREEKHSRGYLPFANSPQCLDGPREEEPKVRGTNTRRWSIRRMGIILHIAILTAALFIAGWPNRDSSLTPGIRFLTSHAPSAFNPHDPQGPQKFWFAISAIGTVWSCGRISLVRRILESRFAQYVGRNSFAIYCIHGPVFNMFQDTVLGVSRRTERWVDGKGSGLRGRIGINTAWDRTLCWALGFAILFPLVLVAAHFFCRFVDEPLVGLAKRIESSVVSDADAELERETKS
ncbi:hypothetical protein EKO27_g1204 [Xylaria grammica]|uniref:Acyltransferase 3 domain-containing protein n=1 Tax=Xylaria grammica TaxID=363999 RepID=A0A439DHM3_9PEZI|nr:hypothetical protein EKO27_g1204 [Xylaria grammica]